MLPCTAFALFINKRNFEAFIYLFKLLYYICKFHTSYCEGILLNEPVINYFFFNLLHKSNSLYNLHFSCFALNLKKHKNKLCSRRNDCV